MIISTPPIGTATCALACFGLVTLAHAENEFSVDTGISTLGITVTPGYRLNDMVGFRAPLGFMKAGQSFEDEGTTVKGTATIGGIGALVDYYPTDTGFRLTGGGILPLYKVTAKSDGGSTVIDNVEYAVSDLDAHVKSTGIAPYVGLGYQFGNQKAGWSGGFDLGVMFNVSYSHDYSYSADQLLAIDPSGQTKAQFDAAVEDAANELQAELQENADVVPFISISATYRF